MSVMDGAPGKKGNASGELGVRTALRTHSRRAVSAGTLLVWPGRVTVACCRPAFVLVIKGLISQGGKLGSPLSPMSSPWSGSKLVGLPASAVGSLQTTV